MYLSLAYFLDDGVESLDRIRQEYDPTFDLIRPHVPIVFPVPDSVGRSAVIEHIRSTLDGWQAFPARFRGFETSPDHWLFLKVDEGAEELARMFESLYRGVLAPFRRHDITYVPHVGLGLFVRKDVTYDMSATPKATDLDEPTYRQALQEAEALNIDLSAHIRRLHLVELSDDVLAWARGARADFPTGARARSTAEFDLAPRA